MTKNLSVLILIAVCFAPATAHGHEALPLGGPNSIFRDALLDKMVEPGN